MDESPNVCGRARLRLDGSGISNPAHGVFRRISFKEDGKAGGNRKEPESPKCRQETWMGARKLQIIAMNGQDIGGTDENQGFRHIGCCQDPLSGIMGRSNSGRWVDTIPLFPFGLKWALSFCGPVLFAVWGAVSSFPPSV